MQPRSNRNGHDQDHPLQLGEPDGDVLLVETTGLAFGIHKGKRRWVTGTEVQPAIDAGLLRPVLYSDDPLPPRPSTSTTESVTTTDPTPIEEDNGGQELQGAETHEEPASGPTVVGIAGETSTATPDATDGYAAVAAAHAAYEAEEVAAMSIPATKAWISRGDDGDLARAEAVEAREATRGDDARKGILEHVEAMLASGED